MGTNSRVALLALTAALASCSDDGAVDAAADVPDQPLDARIDDGAEPLVFDFVVQGCTERSPDQCRGEVPLKLTFTIVGPANLVGSWEMGDGGEKTGRVVSHTFVEPGLYSVTLTVPHGSGTASEHKENLVLAAAAGPASACSADNQCASGVCVCQEAACEFPLADGFCLQACSGGCAAAELACADLSLAAGGGPWRAELCLPRCSEEAPCARVGFTCGLAPAGGSWQPVCMPQQLGFIGESCRRGDGTVDDAACVGGVCLDLGAAGYCSTTCESGTCPDGTRCVEFSSAQIGGGAPVCLALCAGDVCAADPLLACEVPSGEGVLGFEVVGPRDPPGTTYCTAKRCEGKGDCASGGACVAGFCQLD